MAYARRRPGAPCRPLRLAYSAPAAAPQHITTVGWEMWSLCRRCGWPIDPAVTTHPNCHPNQDTA